MELYYANNVDGEFQKTYSLLIDKKKNVLSKEEKLKVLFVCLSFYFRTPINLNHSNKFTNMIFERLKLHADENGIIKTTMFGEKEIHIDELDKIEGESKEETKTRFHIEHLEKWMDFVQHKYECTINVVEIQDKETHLITSDNPVVIREMGSNQFNGLFNPANVISLPLDPKHFLEIHPNTVANDEYRIHRLTHDMDYVFTTNGMTQQNAESLLIGKKGTLDLHFKLQAEYEEGHNGERFLSKAKFKLESMEKLLVMIEKCGLKSQEAIDQLKKMYASPHFKNDKQIEQKVQLYKELKIW